MTLYVDTGCTCRFRVTADGVQIAAVRSAGHNEQHDCGCNQYNDQQHGEAADIALTEKYDRIADTVDRCAVCHQISQTADGHLRRERYDEGHKTDVACEVAIDCADDHAAKDSGNNGHQCTVGLCVNNRNDNAAECYVGTGGKVNAAADQQTGHAQCDDRVYADISRHTHQVGAGEELRRKNGAYDQAEDQNQHNTEFTV